MPIITNGEFDEDASRALDAATNGPVFITENGKATYVLLNIEDYTKFIGRAGRDIQQFRAVQDGEQN